MTISSTTRSNTYTSAGTTNTFNYSYYVFVNTHLKVTVTNAAGTVSYSLALSTDGTTNDYTVTGLNLTAGGSITLVNRSQAYMSGGILAAGYIITIERVVPLTQVTNVRGEGPYNPEIHENEYDLLCMADQQIQAALTGVQAVVSILGYLTLPALSTDPAAPSSGAILYVTSSGGKASLKVLCSTGSPIVLATQA